MSKAPLTWDEYFMLQAMMASTRSKDPSTKVGSVIVDQKNHQISMGYNGFVAGIDESQLPWSKDLNEGLVNTKYAYVVHAEANAILHAPASLEGARCYVTLFPCNECAKLMASKGIKEVIYLSDKHLNRDHNVAAKKIFDLTGIEYRQFEISEGLLNKIDDHLKKLISDL